MKQGREFADGRHAESEVAGSKFYRLTAVRQTGRDRYRCAVWEFKCDCGNVVSAALTRVKNGYTKSCGCQRSDSAKARVVPMLGRKFGRLTVIERAPNSQYRWARWECQCECGNRIVVDGCSLRKGVTQSCGCRKRELCADLGKSHALSEPELAASFQRRRKAARDWQRRRRKSDPVYRMCKSLGQCLKSALDRINERKPAATFRLLPYTPDDLKSHLERQFVDGMSWRNYGEWQIDHIVPLCEARSIDDALRINALSNLRPLWRLDNMRKNGRRTLLC